MGIHKEQRGEVEMKRSYKSQNSFLPSFLSPAARREKCLLAFFDETAFKY